MRHIILTAATAAVLVAPASALAQSEGIRGTWTATVRGGSALPLTGDVHNGGTGTVLGLPTTVGARGYNDIYDAGFGFRAGLGYGIARNVEVFGDFTYGRADAKDLSVGTVAGLDLRAQFASYASRGVEGGVRLHFAPDATVNPYLALVGGVKRIDAIPATFRVPDAGVTLADTPFYDASTVPTLGGDLGLSFAVAPRVALGLEAGLRYHTKLQRLNGLAGTGLENLNDAGDRWAFPVAGVLKFRF
jgi:hypothetical protein